MPPGFTYCTDYPHLFHLDPVNTAIWFISFILIILNILLRTMSCASSIHNNLYSNTFPSSVNIHFVVHVLQSCEADTDIYHLAILKSSDWSSRSEIYALFVYSLQNFLDFCHRHIVVSITICCTERLHLK
jgi:hypothetical protein